MKKVCLYILVALLALCPCFMLVSAAEDKLVLTVDEITGNEGDEVEVKVTAELSFADEATSMDSLQFALIYDAEALSCLLAVKDADDNIVSELGAKDFMLMENDLGGEYRFMMASAFGTRTNGVVVTLRFKLLKSGSYKLGLSDAIYSFYNTDTKEQSNYTIEETLAEDSAYRATKKPTMTPAEDDIEDAADIAKSSEENNSVMLWIVLAAVAAALVVVVVILVKMRGKSKK